MGEEPKKAEWQPDLNKKYRKGFSGKDKNKLLEVVHRTEGADVLYKQLKDGTGDDNFKKIMAYLLKLNDN